MNKYIWNPGDVIVRKPIKVGSYIVNHGVLGYVRKVKRNGDLVVENPRIGRWIADPEKCTLCKEPMQEV